MTMGLKLSECGHSGVITIADNRADKIGGGALLSTGSRARSCTIVGNTAGLRGFKGDTYEGGVRVPFCMRWPGQIKPGIT